MNTFREKSGDLAQAGGRKEGREEGERVVRPSQSWRAAPEGQEANFEEEEEDICFGRRRRQSGRRRSGFEERAQKRGGTECQKNDCKNTGRSGGDSQLDRGMQLLASCTRVRTEQLKVQVPRGGTPQIESQRGPNCCCHRFCPRDAKGAI